MAPTSHYEVMLHCVAIAAVSSRFVGMGGKYSTHLLIIHNFKQFFLWHIQDSSIQTTNNCEGTSDDC